MHDMKTRSCLKAKLEVSEIESDKGRANRKVRGDSHKAIFHFGLLRYLGT